MLEGLKGKSKYGSFEGFLSQGSKGRMNLRLRSSFEGERRLEGREIKKGGKKGGAGPRVKKKKRKRPPLYKVDRVEQNRTEPDRTQFEPKSKLKPNRASKRLQIERRFNPSLTHSSPTCSEESEDFLNRFTAFFGSF